MRELALHILDVAENSVAARAQSVEISVLEDVASDRLSISVRDDGIGMDEEMLGQVTDPFVTSRTTRRVGLGIPFLKAAAESCNGSFVIDSTPGKGTWLQVDFQHSHIDRMPLGDLSGTMLTLLVTFPDTHWVFRYSVNGTEFVFDDALVKETLAGVSLAEPQVLAYLRDWLQVGMADVRAVPGAHAGD